jgi:hypothetical protein
MFNHVFFRYFSRYRFCGLLTISAKLIKNEEVLTTFRELYESRVAEFGEKDHLTISAGMKYAKELLKAGRGDESWELLFKLLATSKQVLGSHHSTTKEVALALKWNRGISYISRILFVFILIGVLDSGSLVIHHLFGRI